MRTVPASLDPGVVAGIDERLSGVEAAHGVRVLWAIESGSRAWGFPSPDSDYDARFLYLRPAADYLSLWPVRDVIETPLDAVFDVNGWDLAKAVRLIVKGNAAALEWLRSPIVYFGDAAFRDRALALAERVTRREDLGRHYLHVARQQRLGRANLKRFFYVLRPAAALHWLAEHPDRILPPMDLPTLLAEANPGAAVRSAAEGLIALKSRTREMGAGEVPAVLAEFVERELARAVVFEAAGEDPAERAAARRDADAFFRAELALSN
ncbi:nucleotidyltransferase domain-containing protein [Galactobacter valiniphilus]|uniref:Nucleotidyltransferase domain-containing protein n=1 Tax=Galactobacter valiniphilus TaxID=2676122 RepID=A0A399J9I8_9MICC|nr:nucleotidyltransferase domain-containing protein [Galactobacter valiniphilus]RII41177.1 nucleotidyltransferase domain-containing protein [Galactobacter valiniphilus]